MLGTLLQYTVSSLDNAEGMLVFNSFYCFKVGHQAKECHKKQADCAKSSGRPTNNSSHVNKGQTTPDMTPDDIAQFLKDNVDTIDDETKLSIIEKILPMGFLTGSN